MKSLVCSMLVLAAAGLLALGGGSPSAPAPAFASVDVPQFDIDANKLIVGNPPDQLALVDIKAGEVTPVAEPKFTQPAKIVAVSHPAKPVAKSQPAASGQWVTRYAGFRGRRSYFEWVPASSSSGACTNGSCSPPAASSFSGFGSCSSGRCRSCR